MPKIICFCLLLQLIFLLTISCASFDIDDIEKSQKIAVMPLTNLTGYDLTKFPMLIYKDSELSKLFSTLPPKTANLATLLEFELEKKLVDANVNVVSAFEIQQKIAKNVDYPGQRKILTEDFKAEFSAHLVLKRINVGKIFSEKKIVIYAGLLFVSNDTGSLLSKTEEEFIFELPQSVFSPLGADLSKAISTIKKYIIQKLLE